MTNDKQIDVLRVEVLDSNVQRYSSTAVSGGGGYVASVNGTTYGQTDTIRSTVQHHAAQDLWVKDLASGRERQLSFQDLQIPARPGHQLWLVYDHQSRQWERIVNESTGEATYGTGSTNPNYTAKLKNEMRGIFLSVVLLIIPMINIIGGVVALISLINASTSFNAKSVPGVGGRFLKILALGVGLFFAGWWVVAVTLLEPQKNGALTKFLSLAVAAILISMFMKTYRSMYFMAIETIGDRSKTIDAVLTQARTKQPTSPAA